MATRRGKPERRLTESATHSTPRHRLDCAKDSASDGDRTRPRCSSRVVLNLVVKPTNRVRV